MDVNKPLLTKMLKLCLKWKNTRIGYVFSFILNVEC